MQNPNYVFIEHEQLSTFVKNGAFHPNISAVGLRFCDNKTSNKMITLSTSTEFSKKPVKRPSAPMIDNSSEPNIEPPTKRMLDDNDLTTWSVQSVVGRRRIQPTVNTTSCRFSIIQDTGSDRADDVLNKEAALVYQRQHPSLIPTITIMETVDPRI
ncbi:hypothetical protein CAEBREN_09961 [Caenorhabditis brenneri]|uniref:Uncharacterized protein n=1 Tax=Caenorhabditis brenneri TaxID=135651 RepID=G0N483_CAEBE|nr:hypothetical protein CAEBREN_09961 [Caenorhabditis brenneri]